MATDQELSNLKTKLENMLSAIKNRIDVVDGFHESLKGVKGSVFYGAPDGLNPEPLLKLDPVLVRGSAEADAQKGSGESFQEVFDTWLRFSHKGDLGFPANETELSGWSFNTTTGQIESTINSTTFIGFVSDKKFEDYVFEVNVSSTNGDDDFIGIVLGFAIDSNGNEHTISAIRAMSRGGIMVRYNFSQSNGFRVGNVSSGLLFGDGQRDGERTTVWESNQPDSGWDDWPGGCRIRAERVGDVFTVKTTDITTDINNPGPFVDSATVVFNLNDHPELAIFKGATQYGYGALSQAAATFDTIARPSTLGIIHDQLNNDFWRWNGSEFVLDNTLTVDTVFKDQRLYYNQVTQRLHVKTNNRGLVEIKPNL